MIFWSFFSLSLGNWIHLYATSIYFSSTNLWTRIFCLVHSLNLTILSRLNQIKFDMGNEYKQSMTMMMGMSGVPWHFRKFLMKMLYIETTNDGINDYMINWKWKWGQYWRYIVGVWVIFESWNPPLPWMHPTSLIMSNSNAYKNNLKKFQHWPHSQLIVWGQHERHLFHIHRWIKIHGEICRKHKFHLHSTHS